MTPADTEVAPSAIAEKSPPVTVARRHSLFNEVMQSDDISCWVLNTTAGKTLRGQKLRASNVIMSIIISGDTTASVSVPPTFVPIDLGLQVPKKVLFESLDFRRLLNQGLLTLISSEDAEKLMTEPGAYEEAQRLRDMDLGNFDRDDAVPVDGTEEAAVVLPDPQLAQEQIRQQQQRVDVDPMVYELAMRANATGPDRITDVELLASLRSNASGLEKKDLEHIVSQCSSDTFPNSVKWAIETLAKKTEG